MTIKDFPELLRATYAAWNRDKVPRLGAALSYYTIFSLAPLMVVVIGVASLFFGEAAARGQVVQQIQGTVGQTAAKAVEEMLRNAHRGGQGGSLLATLIGLTTVLLGAGALFGQLQDSLDTIWGVQPRADAGYWYLIRTRFVSFAMVLGVGFLLLVSLVLSAGLSAFSGWINAHLGHAAGLAGALDSVMSLGIFTLLFMGIYKVLPDVELGWGDVWVGAVFTSLLFGVGKFALGLYLGRAGVASAYGSAGALIVLLLWVYYASQILFFGAEFTKVRAAKYGSPVLPSPHAELIATDARLLPTAVSPASMASSPGKNPGITPVVDSGALPPMGAQILGCDVGGRARQELEHAIAVALGGLLAFLWFWWRPHSENTGKSAT